jgi:hypothetical protein
LSQKGWSVSVEMHRSLPASVKQKFKFQRRKCLAQITDCENFVYFFSSGLAHVETIRIKVNASSVQKSNFFLSRTKVDPKKQTQRRRTSRRHLPFVKPPAHVALQSLASAFSLIHLVILKIYIGTLNSCVLVLACMYMPYIVNVITFNKFAIYKFSLLIFFFLSIGYYTTSHRSERKYTLHVDSISRVPPLFFFFFFSFSLPFFFFVYATTFSSYKNLAEEEKRTCVFSPRPFQLSNRSCLFFFLYLR